MPYVEDILDLEPNTDFYVAFIDVLGFKQILQNDEVVKSYFKTAIDIIETLVEHIPDKAQLKYFLISDSIVLALPTNSTDALYNLVSAIRTLQFELFRIKILMRGAVTRGYLRHDKKRNVVWGEALVRAYELEEKEAIYPRVIIDPSLVKTSRLEFVKDLNSHFMDRNTEHPHCHDLIFLKGKQLRSNLDYFKDDKIFINYLQNIENLDEERFYNILEFISESLNSNGTVFAKYKWLLEYLSLQLERFDGSDSITPKFILKLEEIV